MDSTTEAGLLSCVCGDSTMKSIVQLLVHVKKTRSALDRGKKADANGAGSSRNTMCVPSTTSVYVSLSAIAGVCQWWWCGVTNVDSGAVTISLRRPHGIFSPLRFKSRSSPTAVFAICCPCDSSVERSIRSSPATNN